MDRKYPPRTSDDVTIVRGILNGDTGIDFLPQTRLGTTDPLPLGDPYPADATIPGIAPFSARSFLGQAQSVLPNAQESLGPHPRHGRKPCRRPCPRIEAAADEIGALAKAAREFVPELRKTNSAGADPARRRGAGRPGRPAAGRAGVGRRCSRRPLAAGPAGPAGHRASRPCQEITRAVADRPAGGRGHPGGGPPQRAGDRQDRGRRPGGDRPHQRPAQPGPTAGPWPPP